MNRSLSLCPEAGPQLPYFRRSSIECKKKIHIAAYWMKRFLFHFSALLLLYSNYCRKNEPANKNANNVKIREIRRQMFAGARIEKSTWKVVKEVVLCTEEDEKHFIYLLNSVKMWSLDLGIKKNRKKNKEKHRPQQILNEMRWVRALTMEQ